MKTCCALSIPPKLNVRFDPLLECQKCTCGEEGYGCQRSMTGAELLDNLKAWRDYIPEPTEALETLPSGAKQAKEVEGYIHISYHALKLLAAVRKYGVDKYGPENHLGIPIQSHLDHAIAHIYKFHNGVPSEHNLLGDDSPVEHLGHAMCRLTMAIDVYVKDLLSSVEAGERGG